MTSLFYFCETNIFQMQKQLIDYLSGFATPQRVELFNKIINQRTGYIRVVLEDIYQPQNASAVLRTCDCFGIQYVHVVENQHEFTVDKEVAMGASKWLTVQNHNTEENNSLQTIRQLKQQGYRIVATSPHTNDRLLPDFDLSKGKVALVFGSEMPGISEIIENEADEFLKIPMVGFTESFNLSVSAAIILYQLTEKMKKDSSVDWKLTESEKETIKLQWLRNSIKSSELLEQQFLERLGK